VFVAMNVARMKGVAIRVLPFGSGPNVRKNVASGSVMSKSGEGILG